MVYVMRNPHNKKNLNEGEERYSRGKAEDSNPSIKAPKKSTNFPSHASQNDFVSPSHLYFEVFCYATEDLEKVKKSILNIMPEDIRDRIDFKISESRGYHGDPIIIMRGEIKGNKSVTSFLENLSKSMDPNDKFLLSEKFLEYLDERGNLYLRISKQDAFLERLKIGEKDVIKIKVSFQAYGKNKLDKILEYCKRLGLV
ncbi:MAG: RNA-binding domain-containing protein [Candidatus Asgardarchaeia archaeon]